MVRSIMLLSAFVFAMPALAQDKEVPVVTYDGLIKEVVKHRGKVLVVDFWATNCLPCIQKLPNMVEMQKKYGPEGLVVMTVSLDELNKEGRDPKQLRAQIVKILKATKADEMISLHLDIPSSDWQKRFRFSEIPSVYIFDRQGKWTLESPPKLDEMEKLVKQLLSEK